jgi:seryl-tRNA synthetase
LQEDARALRERSNVLKKQLPQLKKDAPDGEEMVHVLREAKEIKQSLAGIEKEESEAMSEMEELALALPNLTSEDTPHGADFKVLSYINDEGSSSTNNAETKALSHVDIGTKLGILDFAAAGTASGWGWYYLVGAGSLLEHALVSYALAVATRSGWTPVSPPSMVYSHISSACGFQPRDTSGEQQVYNLAQDEKDKARGVPEMSLTGTSEIALAGMKANTTLKESELPMKRVAASRCYRAEAGARGADTKGLYRVHEFTKVELFAWTHPEEEMTTEIFEEMLDIQTEILGSLGLKCRVLEMPSHDLGASAIRKIDMEAYFPSRAVGKTPAEAEEAGWGEVTSASICTDYQTRRLGTRMRQSQGLGFPWTVNGTALAVPRIIAALLEKGWDEETGSVVLPEVLRPFMGGMERIEGGDK